MAITLTRKNLSKITDAKVSLPSSLSFDLPERVIQFGTGVLLRGLPDYFIHKANQTNIFNGRILVVKSTSVGTKDAFAEQDGLYTLCISGIENGQMVEEKIINSSISRVLSAKNDWAEILKSAGSPEMQIVISNTTEVGIVESEDLIQDNPPKTYPGKLLSFLFKRFEIFEGSPSSGMVILPTELISSNADVLKRILMKLAKHNNLSDQFLEWLTNHNYFCNTLVDRIVPGKLSSNDLAELEENSGYTDELAIMAEPFRLWAIESKAPQVSKIVSFATVDDGIFIVPSIAKFKELKLRLLNGTHTMVCALAILAGYDTVKDAMANDAFKQHVLQVMETEIAPVVESDQISKQEASKFAQSVVDRFSNPTLEHHWQSITLNYTSKIKLRNLPLIEKFYATENKIPKRSALGIAAFIMLMNTKKEEDNYIAHVGEVSFKIQDESAATLYQHWQKPEHAVKDILSDVNLWGTDLTKYKGFTEAVENDVHILKTKGAKEFLAELISK